MDFASRIAALRKDLHLSQEKFGEMFDVSQRTVAAWEAGDRLPSLSALDDLASRLQVSVDYLMGRTSPEDTKKEPAQVGELRDSILSRVQSLSDPALVRVMDFLDGLEAGQSIGPALPAARDPDAGSGP